MSASLMQQLKTLKMNLQATIPSAPKSYVHLSPVKLIKSDSPVEAIPEDPRKFIYTLVHEIRNPLTNINLAIEELKQTAREEVHAIYLDILIRNSDRIKNMLTDLLTSTNKKEIKPKTHSIPYLIQEVLMTNKDRLQLKNITVTRNHSTEDFKINLDSFKVKIALTNIIINAIEAMPAKNGLLEITTKQLRSVYYIVIKDNGTGISKENLTNLFKPYFTNKPGGMGLGLSGSLSILKANHIGINVRSEVGKGTRFILTYKKKS